MRRFPQTSFLLTTTALCLAIAAIALAVHYQSGELGQRQAASVRSAYLTSKRAELKRQVELALHAVTPLHEGGRVDAATRRQARQLLATLQASTDGHFFVYDQDGHDVIHPREPELAGADMADWHDADGASPLQLLSERANRGKGGFVRYAWRKSETASPVLKLAYVASLPRWGWVVGSSVYLDEIDTALAGINAQLAGHLRQAMLLVAAVAMGGALAAALPGLLALLGGVAPQAGTARQVDDMLVEGRRRPHALRPALDAPGLVVALEQLCRHWCTRFAPAMAVRFNGEGEPDWLPEAANAVLLLLARETLANIAEEGRASEVCMRLRGDASLVMLQVRDNAASGEPGPLRRELLQSEHLRSLRGQLEAMGGALALDTCAAGSLLSVVIMRDMLPARLPQPGTTGRG